MNYRSGSAGWNKAEGPKKSAETTIFRTMGTDPFLSRSLDSPPISLLFTEQSKFSGGMSLELEVEHESEQRAVRDSGFNMGVGLGRGVHGPSNGFKLLRVPQALFAFTQGGVKVNGLNFPIINYHTHKCDKCALEFHSQVNLRRHWRKHRKALEQENLEKDRESLAEFWDQLSLSEAKKIIDVEDTIVDELSGSDTAKAMAGYLQHATFMSHPPYVRAGCKLESIQKKASSIHVSARELFEVLDDASEKNFLVGGASAAVARYILQTGTPKGAYQDRNSIASFAFLVENKLLQAWNADKDAKSRLQEEMILQQDAAEKQKKEKIMEKKRLKKQKQKDKKAAEISLQNGTIEDADSVTTALSIEEMPHQDPDHGNDKSAISETWVGYSEAADDDQESFREPARKSRKHSVSVPEQDGGWSTYRYPKFPKTRSPSAVANGYSMWARKSKGTGVRDASTEDFGFLEHSSSERSVSEVVTETRVLEEEMVSETQALEEQVIPETGPLEERVLQVISETEVFEERILLEAKELITTSHEEKPAENGVLTTEEHPPIELAVICNELQEASSGSDVDGPKTDVDGRTIDVAGPSDTSVLIGSVSVPLGGHVWESFKARLVPLSLENEGQPSVKELPKESSAPAARDEVCLVQYDVFCSFLSERWEAAIANKDAERSSDAEGVEKGLDRTDEGVDKRENGTYKKSEQRYKKKQGQAPQA